MFELVRKDFGMCRMLLGGFGIAVVLPYLAFAAYGLYEMNTSAANSLQNWGTLFSLATVFSGVITVGSFPFLGGYIVAGERRERCAEFLAYLPPKRSEILISKFLICLGWTIFALTVFLVMSQIVVPSLMGDEATTRLSWETTPGMFAMFASMFGVAWMLSCIITSPVFAVVGGLCTPFIVLIFGLCISMMFEERIDHLGTPLNMFIIFTTIAVGAFVTGCFCYVRRVEP